MVMTEFVRPTSSEEGSDSSESEFGSGSYQPSVEIGFNGGYEEFNFGAEHMGSTSPQDHKIRICTALTCMQIANKAVAGVLLLSAYMTIGYNAWVNSKTPVDAFYDYTSHYQPPSTVNEQWARTFFTITIMLYNFRMTVPLLGHLFVKNPVQFIHDASEGDLFSCKLLNQVVMVLSLFNCIEGVILGFRLYIGGSELSEVVGAMIAGIIGAAFEFMDALTHYLHSDEHHGHSHGRGHSHGGGHADGGKESASTLTYSRCIALTINVLGILAVTSVAFLNNSPIGLGGNQTGINETLSGNSTSMTVNAPAAWYDYPVGNTMLNPSVTGISFLVVLLLARIGNSGPTVNFLDAVLAKTGECSWCSADNDSESHEHEHEHHQIQYVGIPVFPFPAEKQLWCLYVFLLMINLGVHAVQFIQDAMPDRDDVGVVASGSGLAALEAQWHMVHVLELLLTTAFCINLAKFLSCSARPAVRGDGGLEQPLTDVELVDVSELVVSDAASEGRRQGGIFCCCRRRRRVELELRDTSLVSTIEDYRARVARAGL